MIPLTETRERFLAAITGQIPADRIAEIHFFEPIRQGGVESGVAVVVERGQRDPAEATGTGSDDAVAEAAGELGEPVELDETAVAGRPFARYVVHTARYRLTLKGIDRGKWEANVFAEADAPLVTVEAVVRGVQRRSGDVDDVTRMDGDDVRALSGVKVSPEKTRSVS